MGRDRPRNAPEGPEAREGARGPTLAPNGPEGSGNGAGLAPPGWGGWFPGPAFGFGSVLPALRFSPRCREAGFSKENGGKGEQAKPVRD